MKTKRFSFTFYAIYCIILLASIWTYKSGLSYDFTNLDDQVQIVNNQNIREFSLEKTISIFSSTSVGMYQPVSTFFYAITYSISGLNPKGFHILSLLFHLANTALIFQLLKRLNIRPISALILCGIFALHPMQVESVVWLSAFSNLCFTSFLLLAFLSFLKFRKTEKNSFYFFSLCLFILAGLAKSSAVFFPILLIAFDFILEKKSILQSTINKIPFILISITLGIVTILSRETAGHLSDLSISFSLFDRFFLICHSILFYPIKFLLPINLSPFYAYPQLTEGLLPLSYYLSPLLLVAIVILLWKTRPNRIVLFGLSIYLIGIGLVLQFIPVGNQLTTDRYIYLPMFGFLVILGHYLAKIQNKRIIYLLGIVPVFLALISSKQVEVWQNDQTVWAHVISKDPTVAQAYNNLGSSILKEQKHQLAMQHFNEAIALKPYYADAFSNRGSLYADMGKSDLAMKDLSKAISLRPHADAYFNRANEFIKLKDLNSALADYSKSIELKPSADAFTNRAFVYAQTKQSEKAINDLNQALTLNPNYGQAYFLIGMIYNNEGNKNKACIALNKASKLNHVKAKQALQQICN